jgi:hypothetical protein
MANARSPDGTVVLAGVPHAGLIDEFLTGYVVGAGLCLNYDVTYRMLLGSNTENCAGPACSLRRLCLSRALRRHLDAAAQDPWLRGVFDVALLEIGNGP